MKNKLKKLLLGGITVAVVALVASIIPAGILPRSVGLPIVWGDLPARLVSAGVIDPAKVTLSPSDNGGYPLNLLWAFGLANKNPILEEGEMMDPAYGGDPSRFASVGGWTLARGDPMDHYSHHQFVTLTSEQQELVDRLSRQIYRPCCRNSAHFPDCNHGMAMLGLLELMAAQNVSEGEMLAAAGRANAAWFPEYYFNQAGGGGCSV